MSEKDTNHISTLLKKYPVFNEIDNGKLLCTLTKHELPISQLSTYLASKKFLNEWNLHEILQDYFEYFEDMPDHKNVLVCKITKRTLTRDAKTIKNHVNGVRFKRALEIAKKEKIDMENSEEANKEVLNTNNLQTLEESNDMMDTEEIVENENNQKKNKKNNRNKKNHKRIINGSMASEKEKEISDSADLMETQSGDDLSQTVVKKSKKKNKKH